MDKGDASWSTTKTILGWVVDTLASTITLPAHHILRLHEVIDSIKPTQRRVSLAHTVIDSSGGIWTKLVVRRRARLTINQNNETNTSISNSRYRLTYSKPSISNRLHRSTKTI
jgi:hypothetical protein